MLEEGNHSSSEPFIEGIKIEFQEDAINSKFSMVIYESTITKKDEKLYIEYDFDVEFINGLHENFTKTINLSREKWDARMFEIDNPIGLLFLYLLMLLKGN
jgi:hypothetical protein